MFAKIFETIFDSSVSEDYLLRLVFQDMLVLADIDGVVDRTREAIARRTNVPIDIVRQKIETLEQPDPSSRNVSEDGRRIVRLDPHRDWGWRIVNYQFYRQLRDAAQRREYNRNRMQRVRAEKRAMQMGRRNDGTDGIGRPLAGEIGYQRAADRGAGEEELGKLADPAEALKAREDGSGEKEA